MQRKIKNFLINDVLAIFLSCLMLSAVQAAKPVWTFEPLTTTTVSVLANSTATVQYRVTNQSHKTHTLTMQPIQGVTQITTGANACGNPFVMEGKHSCILSLQIHGNQLTNPIADGPVVCQQGNPNQCYRPSAENILRITKEPLAILKVSPTTLLFAENSTGDVIVTNDAGSPVAANHVAATIPNDSNLSVQSTTCPASLAPGRNCTITFASSTQEGPTVVPVAGDNTTALNVTITVTSQPVIAIVGPSQEQRVIDVDGSSATASSPLEIAVQNDSDSVVAANNIDVTDKTSCPDVAVDNSDCNSVAPGETCTLSLTSATPYAPCTIVISGSNTANSPDTPIAFFYVGGLVFEESSGSGKVVTDLPQDGDELASRWSTSFNDVNTDTDEDSGPTNTDNIIAQDSSACGSADDCAAYRCRNLDGPTPDWYLPARNELINVVDVLCPDNTACNFGGFLSEVYWSSSQVSNDVLDAWIVLFPSGDPRFNRKTVIRPVRCVRAFKS